MIAEIRRLKEKHDAVDAHNPPHIPFPRIARANDSPDTTHAGLRRCLFLLFLAREVRLYPVECVVHEPAKTTSFIVGVAGCSVTGTTVAHPRRRFG